jgi:hypothetical protein
MRFPRRDDPTDSLSPDEAGMMSPMPKTLLWGLAKGAMMLAVVAAATWMASSALEERAINEGLIAAQTRDQAAERPVEGSGSSIP